MSGRNLRLAAGQLGPIARNETRGRIVDRLINLLDEAHKENVDLIVYPELALTTFFPRWFIEEEQDLSLDDFYETEMPGEQTTRLFQQAKEYGIGFCLGYAELTVDGDRYNTQILVDSNGDVIGMNTFTQTNNFAYAIPINYVYDIVEELKVKRFIDRGIDLGLLFINLYTNQLMIKYVHPRVALETDLLVYDIVVSINDTKVSNMKDFSDVLKRSDVRPGDIIKLKILRDDKIKIVNLKTQ